jgi:hypothetical protein
MTVQTNVPQPEWKLTDYTLVSKCVICVVENMH